MRRCAPLGRRGGPPLSVSSFQFPIDNWNLRNLTGCVLLKELITQSWQALMRNRLRSALTMLGIVWGLVSVVILLAYGQGLGGSVLQAFLNMGDNVIVLE